MSPLRAKREQAGLTLTELATRAHMELSKLSRIERGILKLKVEDLQILARVLGCDTGEIMPKLADEPQNGARAIEAPERV